MALFFCLEFRDTLQHMLDREQLRQRLIPRFDSRGRFPAKLANEKSMAREGLWDSLVACSSADAPTAMERIMEVLLRVDPHCPVCGHRCKRGGSTDDKPVFGFRRWCSSKCAGIAKRGIPIVRDEVAAAEKRRTTMLEKYGCEYNTQRPGVVESNVEKFRATCEERYGADWAKDMSMRNVDRDAYRAARHDDYVAGIIDNDVSSPVRYRRGHYDRIKRYKDAHRDKINAAKRSYYKNNDGARHGRDYRRTHEDVCSAISKRYKKNHPEVKRAAGARRRAAKLSATPPWLNHKMELEIRRIYAMASRMSKRDGIEYHVDHIVPLQGATASGLHVPWNLQIIPALDNIVKKNKVPTLDEVCACVDHMKVVMEHHQKVSR